MKQVIEWAYFECTGQIKEGYGGTLWNKPSVVFYYYEPAIAHKNAVRLRKLLYK